jgi:putative membrane protein
VYHPELEVRMQRLILRWAINAVALYIAIGTGWIKGIQAEDTSIWAILVLALIFGIINALLRPLIKFITCPIILLTLGLFTLVINAGLFWLTGWLGGLMGGIGFTVDGWLPALLGGLVVGLVSMVLTLVLKDELKPEHKRRS